VARRTANACKAVAGSAASLPLSTSTSDTATARDISPAVSVLSGPEAAVAVAGGATPASIRSRAMALAHALDGVGPVRVSSDRLVVPVEYLRAALQQCLLLEVNDMVAAAEVSGLLSAA